MLVAACALLASGQVCGQESIVGKYSGNWFPGETTRGRSWGLDLDIREVSGESVKGVASRVVRGRQGPEVCNGEYAVEGTLKGNALRLKSTSAPAAECSLSLTLTVEGNKLTGNTKNGRFELSK